MTTIENHLKKCLTGKWYSISDMPAGTGFATLSDMLQQQPLMPYFKIEMDKFFEYYRVVPAFIERLDPDKIKNDTVKTVILKTEVVIYHGFREIKVNNHIQIGFKTLHYIMKELRRKYAIDEGYSIKTN